MKGRTILKRAFFARKEEPFCQLEGISASTFIYSTGVRALKIRNQHGYIILLPFQGQQIWDAVFKERRLTMENFFEEPIPSNQLLDSYGAFLFHCGALRMGCPGPEDDHPLHGELPGAPYDEASLIFGEDERGSYLGLTGCYRYIKAFGDKYTAIPAVRLYKDSTILDVSITIENRSNYPMELMYMCHVNFFPAENGEIIQAAPWNTDRMLIRSSIPAHVKPTPQFLSFLESLQKNPEATRVLRPQDQYNPEIVFYIKNLGSDARGFTHMIQKHGDGSADYISYNVKELDHTVRWILKNDNQQVLGMALPSTCDPEGYTAEKKKGNVRTIPPQGRTSFQVKTGYLDKSEAGKMEAKIRSL